jgi:hypothetical protein
MSVKEVIAHEALKATPATTNLALTLFGVPLQSWVLIASLVLIACQLFFLFWNNLRRRDEEDTDGPRGSDGTRRGGKPR